MNMIEGFVNLLGEVAQCLSNPPPPPKHTKPHKTKKEPLTPPQIKHLLMLEDGGVEVLDKEGNKYLAIDVVGLDTIKVVTKSGRHILVPIGESYLAVEETVNV